MSAKPDRLQRLTVAIASACLALVFTSSVLLWKLQEAGSGGAVFYGEDALRDPDVRAEVVRKLTEANVHPFDSHPDPDVGRLLVAGGERGDFRTNAIGMRDGPFELEKPAGTVRIVLLGDSYVFGLNIAEADRTSEVLERELSERAQEPKPRFEVLNFAVNSWNVVSECAFLRRQLDRIRPDLVIQITYPNDLDDVTGVRGFGAESSFTPSHAERADSLVMERYAKSYLGLDTPNLLTRGLDWESRARFEASLEAVQDLRTTLAALPGKPAHLLVAHWNVLASAFHRHLGSKLAPESVLYLPLELATDKSVWITPNDAHWNEKGHAQVAEILYGTIVARGLLPGVTLGPWPEAEQHAAEAARKGREFAETTYERLLGAIRDPVAVLEPPEFSQEEAVQIYGGLDREGLVSPYATWVLHRPPGARTLVVTGQALPDEALRGARTRVFLEELEIGALELAPGAPLELRREIPAALDERAWLNLRFVSDDYVYRGDDQRHCVVFRLTRAALE